MCDKPNVEKNIVKVIENLNENQTNQNECGLIKDSRYHMKLNRAMMLYKSIGYVNDHWIKRFAKKHISSFIAFVIVIIMFIFIDKSYLLSIIEKQKGSQEIYEYVIFPLLVILFSIYFDALKNVILKDKIVEKELYEISLDIYDQLCLEQDEDQVNIPWWRSHPIHENRATESICTEPCNPLLRATKSMKRATSTY